MIFKERDYPIWRRAAAGLIDTSIVFVALKIKFFWLSLAALLYILLRDWMNDGQSYGKSSMGLRTTNIDGRSAVSIQQSVSRNIHFFLFAISWKVPYLSLITVPLFVAILGFEFYSMFYIPSSPRLLGLWSKTIVVEDRYIEDFVD